MATKNIVPNADGEGQLGTSSKSWAQGHIDSITGTIATPAQGSITSLGTLTGLTLSGNLVIPNDGTIGSVGTSGALTITSGGDATFSKSVTADQGIFNATANTYVGGSLILKDLNGANPMYITSVVGNLAISNGGANDHLTISSGGTATFTGASGVKLVTSSASDARFDFANQGTGTTIAPNGGGWGIGRDASDGTNTDSFAIAYSATAFPSLTAEAKMRITSGGDVTVSAGNLVIGTAGKGIDFSATSNGGISTPSELLDDYEEGTFTPTITKGSLIGGTIDVALGKYVKVGNLLYVSFYWYQAAGNASSTSGTSGWLLGGLPFSILHGTYSFIPMGYGLISSTNIDVINARWQVNATGTHAYFYATGTNMDLVNNDGNAIEFSGTGVLQCS